MKNCIPQEYLPPRLRSKVLNGDQPLRIKIHSDDEFPYNIQIVDMNTGLQINNVCRLTYNVETGKLNSLTLDVETWECDINISGVWIRPRNHNRILNRIYRWIITKMITGNPRFQHTVKWGLCDQSSIHIAK